MALLVYCKEVRPVAPSGAEACWELADPAMSRPSPMGSCRASHGTSPLTGTLSQGGPCRAEHWVRIIIIQTPTGLNVQDGSVGSPTLSLSLIFYRRSLAESPAPGE